LSRHRVELAKIRRRALIKASVTSGLLLHCRAIVALTCQHTEGSGPEPTCWRRPNGTFKQSPEISALASADRMRPVRRSALRPRMDRIPRRWPHLASVDLRSLRHVVRNRRSLRRGIERGEKPRAKPK